MIESFVLHRGCLPVLILQVFGATLLCELCVVQCTSRLSHCLEAGRRILDAVAVSLALEATVAVDCAVKAMCRVALSATGTWSATACSSSLVCLFVCLFCLID